MIEKNALHPIQLKSIAIKKMNVDVWDMNTVAQYSEDVDLQIEIGRSEFDADESSINIALRLKAGTANADEARQNKQLAPFYLEVELFGLFTVDTTEFQVKHIPLWAEMNAPFLLMPYLREHVYGLASRAGIPDVILPLFIQPPFPHSSK